MPRNINKLCFNTKLLAFAEHARSIDTRIVEEAARDLNLNNVLADVYQMDASRVPSHRKVFPITEAKVPETAGEGAVPRPAVVAQGGILMDAGVPASAPQSGNQDPAGPAAQVPSVPAAARATIAAVVEHKIAPPEIPVPVTETQPTSAPPLTAARPWR